MTAKLVAVQDQIAAAIHQAGRDPKSVTLVAVSKNHDCNTIRPVLAAGQRVFGENRVQEAKQKWPQLKAEFPDTQLHLIGPLQTNKVRDAIALFDVLESLDRPKLARAIAEEMARTGRRPHCLVQINVGDEQQKAGCALRDADTFITLCRSEFSLPICGVMGIPPVDQDPLPYFTLLADIAHRHSLPTISMGMSSDFPAAIQCGATHVRVGTAIFGHRHTAMDRVQTA